MESGECSDRMTHGAEGHLTEVAYSNFTNFVSGDEAQSLLRIALDLRQDSPREAANASISSGWKSGLLCGGIWLRRCTFNFLCDRS